uniref:Bm361 n=1 Tax=Brugia malayi TaxID=6279 RepID=A0A0J9XQY6_BRUMA|nr:Bm361 [Brugia malayi]
MLIYRYINTAAGEFRSETTSEMSLNYLRDQANFIYREERAFYRNPILMQLYADRDRFCFPTSSFVYYFNNIITFSPERYNETRIPLNTTSRYPITLTTETFCYTRPISSTIQFTMQQSQSISNTEYVEATSTPLSSPSPSLFFTPPDMSQVSYQ